MSPDGKLTVIDRQPTGEPVTGRSGTAKSLAYRPQSRTLYVLHAFGPNHLRSYTVAEDGKLKLRPERRSVNTAKKTDRVSTQAVLSPDGRFLLVDILFDARPAANPDGSPNLVVANAPDPDGLVIFRCTTTARSARLRSPMPAARGHSTSPSSTGVAIPS